MEENERKLLGIERMAIMQGFVELYLMQTEHKTFGELYPDVEDKYGVLNEKQVGILHSYLTYVYKSFGLDLNKVLQDKGEEPKEGNLTPFEKQELNRLADEQIVTLSMILKRKEKLFKKQ
jgi:hypothetical protein